MGITLLAVVVPILVVIVLVAFASLFRHAVLVALILASALAGLLAGEASGTAASGFGVTAVVFLAGLVVHTIMDTAHLLAVGGRASKRSRRRTMPAPDRLGAAPARRSSTRRAA